MNTPTSAYQVLARKYRPRSFADLIGQEALVQTLSNAIKTDRIAHAFLLTGIRGVGKTTTARIIARALNCTGEDGNGGPTTEPCGVCDACVSIMQDRHPDILEMDAASRTGVDDIREIIDNASYLPSSARYKIYIIDEVHMLSRNAFNALLKTLEEPPAHVKFIFATTELRKIPVTILSRCQRFDLRRIAPEQLTTHLKNIARKENAEIDDDAVSLLVSAAEGSVRDSLSLLDQAIAHSEGHVDASIINRMLGTANRGRVLHLFDAISQGKTPDALAQLKDLYDDGADPVLVLQDLLDFCHLLTRLKVVIEDRKQATVSGYEISPELLALLETVDVPYLSRCWQMLLKGLEEVKIASHTLMAAEMILIRLAYMSSLPSPADLVRKWKEEGEGTLPEYQPSSTTHSSVGHASGATTTSYQAPQQSYSAHAPSSEPVASLAYAQPVGVLSEESQTIASPKSFEEAVLLFQKLKEPLLYQQLRSAVRLILFERGKIELSTDAHATKDLAGRVGDCLSKWTGERWIVVVSRAKEGTASQTLKEKEHSAFEVEKETLKQHPVIRPIIEQWQGAEIIAIKPKNNPE